jgi:hypothetical protein
MTLLQALFPKQFGPPPPSREAVEARLRKIEEAFAERTEAVPESVLDESAIREDERNRHIRCAFCFKPAGDVKRMIAGPAAYICNECVTLCAQIVEEHQ